jgi:LysM repeat protein
MGIKRFLVFFVIIVSAISLVACELSASTPPPLTEGEQAMQTLQAKLGQMASKTPDKAKGKVTPAPTNTMSAGIPTATPIVQGPITNPTDVPPVINPTDIPLVYTATPGIPTAVPSTYVVQQGEFVYCLARRFNVNPEELLTLNSLGPNPLLQPGMTLNIPQTGNLFPGARALKIHPTNYTVAAGDTVYTIACGFGDVDPLAIVQVNNLTTPYTLIPGQALNIP